MRKNGIAIDLHAVEMSTAKKLLADGCTRDQALAARWGGVTATTADMDVFQTGIDAYEETKKEMGRGPSGETPASKFEAGAIFYLSLVMQDAPSEYERFLRHIRA